MSLRPNDVGDVFFGVRALQNLICKRKNILIGNVLLVDCAASERSG